MVDDTGNQLWLVVNVNDHDRSLIIVIIASSIPKIIAWRIVNDYMTSEDG